MSLYKIKNGITQVFLYVSTKCISLYQFQLIKTSGGYVSVLVARQGV